ncbi:hypothetical protein DVA81_18200, partial [Acinetobacter baumannii]
MKNGKWFLDSGCSRHMTGSKDHFISLTPKDGGYVTFGDDLQGKVIGLGNIGRGNNVLIHDVQLVKGLKH